MNIVDNSNNIIDLKSGSIFNAHNMTRFNNGQFTLENGSTLNAASLSDILGSRLTLGLGMNFNSANLTQVDDARIAVSDGVVFDKVKASSYAHGRNASETIFSLSGSGSTLDLSSLLSLNYGPSGFIVGLL